MYGVVDLWSSDVVPPLLLNAKLCSGSKWKCMILLPDQWCTKQSWAVAEKCICFCYSYVFAMNSEYWIEACICKHVHVVFIHLFVQSFQTITIDYSCLLYYYVYFMSLYLYCIINMWSRRSAIERCPSPRNQIR